MTNIIGTAVNVAVGAHVIKQAQKMKTKKKGRCDRDKKKSFTSRL